MTEKKDSNIDIYDFFLELGSPIRLRILYSLSEGIGNRNFELAKKLKNSPQENLRHLRKLKDCGLVIKEGRDYTLSQIGGLFLEGILPQINFLIRNSNFFLMHDFSVIPPLLKGRFAELVDCHILEGATAIIAKAEDIIINASKQIWDTARLVTTTNSSLIAEKKGLDIRRLVEKNYEDSVRMIIGQERRALDHIDLGMVMSEKEAYLRFPIFLTDELSLNHALFGTNPNFINFCKDLFLFYWEKSNPIPFS